VQALSDAPSAAIVRFADCDTRADSPALTLQSPMFHVVMTATNNLKGFGITISARSNGPNTDGITVRSASASSECDIACGDEQYRGFKSGSGVLQ